jgi:PIN domain nuclease of toxin-antitoxin system
MYTDTKARLNLVVSEEADEKLRKLVFTHRKTVNLSEIVEAMIHHCAQNPQFIKKLTKKEEEIDH